MRIVHRRVRARRKALVASAVVVCGGGLFASAAGATPAPSITTVAGNGDRGSSGDGGPAVKAKFKVPTGVAEDLVGTLYLADTATNTVRKVVQPTAINSDVITNVAGTGKAGFKGDGGPATAAKLSEPSGVAVDGHGRVFIADTGNNRVREVDTSGDISTFAGTGACGKKVPLGDGGPAVKASLCQPTGIALNRAGDLFIADSGHNMVREVKTNGKIVDFAGKGGPGGEAGNNRRAIDARLRFPTGVATDVLGNVYIADTGNSQVRVVNSHGIIRDFAGTGKPGYLGDGGPASKARLDVPTGVAVDPSGDVFISDTGNNRIRQVDPSLAISTYAGTGTAGFSGDGGAATAADIDVPTGIVADGSVVYFADTANKRIRGIFNGPPPVLPESNLAILFPVSGTVLVLGGASFVLMRRRRRSPAV